MTQFLAEISGLLIFLKSGNKLLQSAEGKKTVSKLKWLVQNECWWKNSVISVRVSLCLQIVSKLLILYTHFFSFLSGISYYLTVYSFSVAIIIAKKVLNIPDDSGHYFTFFFPLSILL